MAYNGIEESTDLARVIRPAKEKDLAFQPTSFCLTLSSIYAKVSLDTLLSKGDPERFAQLICRWKTQKLANDQDLTA
jgi:hypothetical protein